MTIFIAVADIDHQRHLIPITGIKRATPDSGHDNCTYLNVDGFGPLVIKMQFDAFIQCLVEAGQVVVK